MADPGSSNFAKDHARNLGRPQSTVPAKMSAFYVLISRWQTKILLQNLPVASEKLFINMQFTLDSKQKHAARPMPWISCRFSHQLRGQKKLSCPRAVSGPIITQCAVAQNRRQSPRANSLIPPRHAERWLLSRVMGIKQRSNVYTSRYLASRQVPSLLILFS